MVPDWVIPTISGTVIAVLGWFFRRLIKDVEDKNTLNQESLKRSQELIDERFKERLMDINKMSDLIKSDIRELSTQVRMIERNITELSFTTKMVDEKAKERLEVLNKNQEQLGQVLQRVLLAEEKINQFGKVILKS